jgi:hypothetical protein
MTLPTSRAGGQPLVIQPVIPTGATDDGRRGSTSNVSPTDPHGPPPWSQTDLHRDATRVRVDARFPPEASL